MKNIGPGLCLSEMQEMHWAYVILCMLIQLLKGKWEQNWQKIWMVF